MSKHQFTIEIAIDDDALASHDDDQAPPPKDPARWETLRDIYDAENIGALDSTLVDIVDYEYQGAEDSAP